MALYRVRGEVLMSEPLKDGWRWKGGKVKGYLELEIDITGLTRVCCSRQDCNGNLGGVCQRKVISIDKDFKCKGFDVDD